MASDDPAGPSGAARRYAQALYSFCEEQGRLDPVTADMQRLGELVEASPELRRVLASPLTRSAEGEKALLALAASQEIGPDVRRLLHVLAANRRLPLLGGVVAGFAALVAEKRGVVTARVASAHPLSEVQEQQLRARLIEIGYGNVRIERTVDPALLGGLVLRVGARLYDTSLRSRLTRLHHAMKGAA